MAASGHPNIRVTHHKTLELTDADSITGRATCVAGVDAHIDRDGLRSLRGVVALELRVGEHRIVGEATVNPHYTGESSLVVRNSGYVDGRTFAVGSSIAATDIPPEMAESLTDPQARVTLTITETEPPAPLVLFGEPAADEGRQRFLWDNADERVDFERAGPRSGPRGVVAVSCPSPAARARALAWVVEAATAGARVATADHGPAEALLAAGFAPDPMLWLGNIRDTGPLRDAVAVTAFPIVVECTDDLGTEILDILDRFDRRPLVSDGFMDIGTRMVAPGLRSSSGTMTIVVPPGTSEVQLGLSSVVKALTEAGVSAKTVSLALTPHGIGKREIYRIVRDLESVRGEN